MLCAERKAITEVGDHGGCRRSRSCGRRRCRRGRKCLRMDDERGAARAARSRWAGRGRRVGVRARDADRGRARRGPPACRIPGWGSARPGGKAVGVSVVYDAAALIAAERSDRAVWADHRVRLEVGLVPATTAPVVAQVSRSGRQAQLRRFLRGCDVVAFGDDEAHDIGALAGRSGSDDVVDVHVVAVAHRRRAGVLTSDENDLEPIAEALRPRVPILRI